MSVDTHESKQPGLYRELLGYLNFSDGTPGTSFQTAVNQLFTEPDAPANPLDLKQRLLSALAELSATGEPGFSDTSQAASVVSTAIDQVLHVGIVRNPIDQFSRSDEHWSLSENHLQASPKPHQKN